MLRLPHLLRPLHPHRARRVNVSLVAVAMGLGLLAGCSEESQPKFADEPTTDSSTPTAAAAPKKESVKEFLVRWAEIESEMQNTGETEKYSALSPGCEACAGLIEKVDEIYANDGFIRTGAMKIEKVKRIGKTYEYKVWTFLPPTAYRESARGPEESFSGGPQGYLFQIPRSGDTYSVTGYARTPR